MARPYRQSRRGESAEETRRRIVEATRALHGEQGIAATSMKQIAARAGVSVGSVYHHFPTYDDAVNACGAHTFAENPIPTAALFDGATGRAERVRRLATAFFRLFAGVRAFGSVLADQERVPVLKPYVELERSVRLDLSRLAVGGDETAATTLAGLIDHGTLDAFTRLGFSPDAAAERVSELANAWLETLQTKEAP
ncbi:MAG: TetR/AcrR family transcriptional regulator [Phenylobacterium sp.]|uniref:TetR/AcrR family transcriptional regulator n=1 Tax=Phenylobacterium sp. TaxID=1871053 RepID=UPI001A559C08|nr:TetR/AcrR family transcriptional regulator [Phenylobacterium sp.]MBL8770602.1 TetR/AcrR family transcriptional regulator [Phenylobacterium sp.]